MSPVPPPPDGYVIGHPDRWAMWARLTDVPVPDWPKHFEKLNAKRLKLMGIATAEQADDFWDDDYLKQTAQPQQFAEFWVTEFTKGKIKSAWYFVSRRDPSTMERTVCIVKPSKVTPWEKRVYLRQVGQPITLAYATDPRDVVAVWNQRMVAA